MKDYPVRFTLILAAGWLVAMLLTAVANSQIIIHTSEGEAARPLPKYVQNLSDADYAQWARWQNAMAEYAAEAHTRYQSPYLRGTQTVTTIDGSRSGQASAYSERYSQGDRTSVSRDIRTNARTSGSATSITTQVRVRNPDYQTKSVRKYNPFCRPKTNTTHDAQGDRIIEPYTALEPDWDNLYVIHDGKVLSVTDVANQPGYLPIPLEHLYRLEMRLFFGDQR